MSGATTGKIGKYTLNEIAYQNQRVGCFIPKSKILNNDYLYQFLSTISSDITKKAYGGGQPNISTKEISKFLIPLPSLEDQKRIAQVLSNCEILIQKRKESIALLDELLKSTFLEMFGDPVRNEKGWKESVLGKVCTKITDGTHRSPPILEEGIPYITAKHIRENKIDFFAKPWYVSEEDHKNIYSRCNPVKGDVLYIKDGATTGKSVVNPYDFEFSLLSSVALLKVDNNILISEFLNAWLNNPIVKQRIITKMAGGAIKRLTLTKIKKFKILIPPLKLQNEFKVIVNKIESIKQDYQTHLQELENLYGSISQKAFKGELDLSKVLLQETKYFSDSSNETQDDFIDFAKKKGNEIEYKKVSKKDLLKYITEPTKKRDITNITYLDFIGMPTELQMKNYASDYSIETDFVDEKLFAQFYLKDNFRDKLFTIVDVEEKFNRYFIPKGRDFNYETWKNHIFSFLDAKPPLLEQSFQNKDNTVKLKLTDEAYKA